MYTTNKYIPIIKSTILTTMCLIIIILISKVQSEALSVQSYIKTNINLNEDNIVSLVKAHTNTTYLHKLELLYGQVHIQLHFENMKQLVEHLNELIDANSFFYLDTVNNVQRLTIDVSEAHTYNLIYKINISKADYLAGKQIEIIPLNE